MRSEIEGGADHNFQRAENDKLPEDAGIFFLKEEHYLHVAEHAGDRHQLFFGRNPEKLAQRPGDGQQDNSVSEPAIELYQGEHVGGEKRQYCGDRRGRRNRRRFMPRADKDRAEDGHRRHMEL